MHNSGTMKHEGFAMFPSASCVAGSSVGLLHLMEVPRYLSKPAHNELRNMEDYMQRQVEVATYMAEKLVSLACMHICAKSWA